MDQSELIRAQRIASNHAIARRDADGVVMYMMPNVSVSVAGGSALIGRDASRAAFVEQFADHAFKGYFRETHEVVLQSPPVRAYEQGRWIGRWRQGAGEHVMRGSYTAVWCATDVGWLIASEVFVQGDAQAHR